LDTPGGRSFFGRDFLGFGGMVVDEKEAEENGEAEGEWRWLHKFGGREWGYAS
jgi:hypothetical protein